MPDLNLIGHPLTGTPFGAALDLCLILAALCWLLSILTREYSWVDRLWQLCPPAYCLIVAAAADFESTRLNLMTVLVTAWGLRLAYNFARKGGFSMGGEDYRWATVRARTGPVGFQLLNVTFIAPGQMLLIWLFTSPMHQAWVWREAPMNALDIGAALAFVALLVGETVADEQMWKFQQDKKRRVAAGEAVAQPFMTTGLFRFSRHPNYFCELGMWWMFYLFAVAGVGRVAALDGPRLHPAERALRRLDSAWRIHIRRPLSVLPGLPDHHPVLAPGAPPTRCRPVGSGLTEVARPATQHREAALEVVPTDVAALQETGTAADIEAFAGVQDAAIVEHLAFSGTQAEPELHGIARRDGKEPA